MAKAPKKKAAKKKSPKEASGTFNKIIKASVNINNSETYLKAKTDYFEFVKGKPISKDLKNDIIEAIAMDGTTPVVVSVNIHDGKLLKKQLTTWLSDNGY